MVHGHLLPGYVTEEMQKAAAEKRKNRQRKSRQSENSNELKADQRKIRRSRQKTRPGNEIG